MMALASWPTGTPASECQELADRARRRMLSTLDNSVSEGLRQDAKRCPGSVAVQSLVAQTALAASARAVAVDAPTALELAREAERLERALAIALQGSAAQDEGRAWETLARLALVRSDPHLAHVYAGRARAQGLAPWRADVLGALAQVEQGRWAPAIDQAERAVGQARGRDRAAARYARAYVLLRSGAPSLALRALQELRVGSRGPDAMIWPLGSLPSHERLHFAALSHLAEGQAAVAVSYWREVATWAHVPTVRRREYLERLEGLDPAAARAVVVEGGPAK